MLGKISRRRFVGDAAAVSLLSLVPRLVGAATGGTRRITVLADEELAPYGRNFTAILQSISVPACTAVCGSEKIHRFLTSMAIGGRPSNT